MIKLKPIVYVPLAVDILHSAHINLLKFAKKKGKVVVGLLTDSAISQYKKIPLLNYNERYKIISSVKYVDEIVLQENWDYSENIIKYKPSYFVHGNDWKDGIQKNQRSKVITCLKKYGGKLIEIPYTKNISSQEIKDKVNTHYNNYSRVSYLNRLIQNNDLVKVIESHSPLTGLIIDNLKIKKKNKIDEFDGMWSSSLTDSSLKGKPDNQSVDYSSRFQNLSDMVDVTKKPIIFDADNGGNVEHLKYTSKTLERLGVSSIVIEDKIGLKKNSLFSDQKGVQQDSIQKFCKKIEMIKQSRSSNDFLITARIESFILGKGINDALKRANSYSEAGSDLILIHSKSNTPKEIFSFTQKFKKSKYYKPIVIVPSSYSTLKEEEMKKEGIKVVIYANHLLRASYKAMFNVAKGILKHERSSNIEKNILSVKDIISLIK
jgi:phosphoenolpyruvate phosphomutase / 2-hydroxyethylphosphonate cytidylyltransferase